LPTCSRRCGLQPEGSCAAGAAASRRREPPGWGAEPWAAGHGGGAGDGRGASGFRTPMMSGPGRAGIICREIDVLQCCIF